MLEKLLPSVYAEFLSRLCPMLGHVIQSSLTGIKENMPVIASKVLAISTWVLIYTFLMIVTE